MRRKALLTLVSALAVLAAASGASAGSYTTLDPGGPADLSEVVPVNVVFVGFGSSVDEAEFEAGLPTVYRPVVRSRLWYGVTEQLGIHYGFDYRLHRPSATWEDRFFGWLSSQATPAPRTLFQNDYNAQLRNVLDVGQNHFIDAPTVEKWLIDNAPAGVDTTRNTIFFVNWHGRPDFKFHVYTKFGEPDPDTGYDFGVQRHSRKLVAWGGTTPDDEETGLGARGEHRIWFYDLSAGPEAWGGNWNVDDRDIDGDGQADYRIPVIWEYAAKGFRSPSALSGDLAQVARYGAINLLFTPSPLYPPYINPNRQPDSINLDIHTFEGWEGVDASERFQTQSLLLDEISEVHRVPYTLDEQEEPLAGQAAECYVQFVNGGICYPDRPQYPSFANLFLDNALNLGRWQDQTLEGYDGSVYEAALLNYASGTHPAAFLGFADDNWVDGTQSGTFNFVNPAVSSFYGLTTTQIHEFGHHFGMSHPHDGYDYETGVDYGPSGRYFFAWLPDEVNSMMSYIDLNWDFSQFDRDNVNRYQAAAYMRNANAIAADLVGKKAAARYLKSADEKLTQAQLALAAHNYAVTFDQAKAAYEDVVAGAKAAGVAISTQINGWTVTPPRKEWKGPVAKRGYSFEDRIGKGTKRSQP